MRFRTTPALVAMAAAFMLFATGAASAAGPKVLLLADTGGTGTAALQSALAAAGNDVTTVTPEYCWNGTNPSLSGFNAVIHLDGSTYSQPLTASAQQALENFVAAGGGFIGSQWDGYERVQGQQTGMNDLVLQLWPGPNNSNSNPTLNVVPGQASHPVLAGIPSSFTFAAAGYDDGPQVVFATQPSTVLMTTGASGGPAVTVRNYGTGHVAFFAIAPNYAGPQDLLNTNIQRLYTNAVSWAAGTPSSVPSVTPTATAAGCQPSAAPLNASGTAVAATEGQGFSGQVASFTDSDNQAVSAYSATITWGDGHSSAGTVSQVGTGSFRVTGSNTYAEEGSYAVSVRITDSDGTAATANSTASVADAAPSAALDSSNDLLVAEGSTHVYKFTTSDYDDSVSVVTSCGANGTKVASTATSFSCTFPDGGNSSVVSVKPTNAKGTPGPTVSQTVTVRNVAPTVALDPGNDLSVSEGSSHNYSYSISDPGQDTVQSVSTSCGGNGTKVGESHTNAGGTFQCSFGDGPANSTVSVNATDSDGQTGNTDTQSVTINNVAPSATISGADSVSEGSTHTYTYSTSDPGDDTVTVETSCGANGTKGAETAGSFDCTFADGPATSNVSVTPKDSDDAVGDAATQKVDIANVAPTVTLSSSNPSSLDESKSGRTFNYTISDPGQDTVQSVATSCGAGGEKTGASNTDTSGSFTCVFAHGPASPTVSVQATDSDGNAGNTDSQSVTVTDPPIKATGSPVSGVEAKAFSGQKVASFTDPAGYATADEYSASISWGDGSSSTGTITKTGDGAFDVTGSHTYAEEGSYTVKVTVTDADNAANSDTATSTATIGDAPIHASGVSPITTGQAYSGPVATFTDEANGPTADFSATVSWGDGSSSAGTIGAADSSGKRTVSGSHTYATTGPFTITVKVIDVGGSTDSATTSVLVYAFASADGGSFTISDKSAAAGGTVTYWGAQWEKANPFASGLTGSASYKGFIGGPASKAAPTCGTTWTSNPGNSSGPPASVPAYMAVVVASKESKAGSAISGDVKKIVVVKTAAGYGNDPGHAGTGTIVGSICG
jgi:hypothetical protein